MSLFEQGGRQVPNKETEFKKKSISVPFLAAF